MVCKIMFLLNVLFMNGGSVYDDERTMPGTRTSDTWIQEDSSYPAAHNALTYHAAPLLNHGTAEYHAQSEMIPIIDSQEIAVCVWTSELNMSLLYSSYDTDVGCIALEVSISGNMAAAKTAFVECDQVDGEVMDDFIKIESASADDKFDLLLSEMYSGAMLALNPKRGGGAGGSGSGSGSEEICCQTPQNILRA